MKFRNLLMNVTVGVLMTSCAPTSFFQSYKVNTDDSINKEENLVYSDDNCKISYNLWSDGGNIGFDFYNSSNENIYIDLNETYLIINGYANEYYKQREFTTSSSKTATASSSATVAVTGVDVYNNVQINQVNANNTAAATNGYAVTLKEKAIICVPPMTSKRISEYSINETLIRSCDLYKYPNKNKIKTKSYSKEESPIVFSNRISYKIGEEENKVENKFYVSEITNYPGGEFLESKYKEFCEQKSMNTTWYFKYYDVDRFYIKYNKGMGSWKH